MSTHDGDASDETVGSLGDEAVRLLGALSGWVTHHGADAHRHADEAVRRTVEEAARLTEGFEEHCATGAAECTWCPVCRAVHAVRAVSPEVRAHVSAAAVSLAKAAAALLATPGSTASGDGEGPDGASTGRTKDRTKDRATEKVQRIRLDDDPDDPTDDRGAAPDDAPVGS